MCALAPPPTGTAARPSGAHHARCLVRINVARNSPATVSGFELWSLVFQRFCVLLWGRSDRITCEFSEEWARSYVWVAQILRVKPLSPLLARACVGLKPSSPLRAGEVRQLKPSSPLRL